MMYALKTGAIIMRTKKWATFTPLAD